MSKNGSQITVITNGTLIDGSGKPPVANRTMVIEGNRIKSIGKPAKKSRIAEHARVIDASGQWIMPGLIDGHCHLSFGFPTMPGVASSRGTTSVEFSTLRAARNAQQVLRAGVTSLSVPGGTWFIDVGLRDAIAAGLLEGPRIYCAGRFIITYGSIIDSEPSWVGTPEHSNGILANSLAEMVTEVRRQCKHGVNFIKLADSTWGDIQTIAPEEIKAVTREAHRRNTPVTIHARGAGSTRAAAEAGVDWILHADLATKADIEAVAEAGVRLLPTMTFLVHIAEIGRDSGRSQAEIDTIKRHIEGGARVLEWARAMGVKVLCGTDSGNSPPMPYGKLHAKEAEILVNYGGYTPMEAIVASTRENAFVVGLEDEVGVLTSGKLADLIILDADPLADIRVLQGGKHLTHVIKDGKEVDLHAQTADVEPLALAAATR